MSGRYDEVRRRLIDRGYLRGPIERFVLREAMAPGSAARTIARSSAKAAIVGAPLLGALLAASTVAANRPLLGALDAAVLWLYFGVLAAAGLFLLDVTAASVAAGWSRGRGARGSDAVRAGLLVAAPLLVYLVVVWARGERRGGVAADVLFLAGALAATSIAAWLAGLVSLAAVVGRTGDIPDRNRRSAALVLGVLAPIAALLFLIPSSGDRNESVPPSAFKTPAGASRFLFLGIDGLDGELVEALEPRGATQRLLTAIASGALFPLRGERGLEPAEVWTTMMTGTPAGTHGVRAAGVARLPGVGAPIAPGAGPVALEAALRFLLPTRTVPSSGAGRRVRTVWEIEALARPTIAVGFWSSWPARGIAGDASGGYVVSDRLLARLLAGAREDRDVAPESLFARLAAGFPAVRSSLREGFDARFALLPREVAALAWESLLIDGFSWRTTRLLREDPRVAAAFVYLPGLDILRTRLGRSHVSGDAGALIASQAIEAYVRWLDEVVFAEAMAAASDSSLVIVAEPGRGARESAEGFVAMAGGGADVACIGPTIDALDIAPLVLRTLDLPASREMSGRVPGACLRDLQSVPASIATWGRRGASVPSSPSDFDPEMVERLKSLGYLR